MGNEQKQEVDAPVFEEVQERISTLYDDVATKVVSELGENPMCIVSGPRASGKSHYLIPRIERKLVSQGVKVVVVDVQTLIGANEPVKRIESQISEVDNGALILDEAGEVGGIQLAKEIMEITHQRGYRLVPVVAGLKEEDQGRLSDLWVQSGVEFGGASPCVVNQPQIRLDDSLASDFLRTTLEDGSAMPQEVVNYVLTTVPNSTRILWNLRGVQSVEDARRQINNNYRHWLRHGIITEDEENSIYRNLVPS